MEHNNSFLPLKIISRKKVNKKLKLKVRYSLYEEEYFQDINRFPSWFLKNN